MNIDPIDFLSEDQKRSLAAKLNEKIEAAIDKVDVEKLAKSIQKEMVAHVDWQYILEDVMDYEKLAKPIQEKIIKALN